MGEPLAKRCFSGTLAGQSGSGKERRLCWCCVWYGKSALFVLITDFVCVISELSGEKIEGSPIGGNGLQQMPPQSNGGLPGGGGDFMNMLCADGSGDTGAGGVQSAGMNQHRASPAISSAPMDAVALSQSAVSQSIGGGMPGQSLDKGAGSVSGSMPVQQSNPGVGFPLGGLDANFGSSADMSAQVRIGN